MSLGKFSKDLQGSLRSATDVVKAKAREVDLSEVRQAGENATKRVKNMIKKEKVESPQKADLSENIQESEKQEEAAKPEYRVRSVATDAALKIIYLLMSADGKILHGEEEKFDEIGRELVPDFENSKAQIVKECADALDKMIDSEDYFDTLCYVADKALEAPENPEKKYISDRHLVWNLLSVAYSDEAYDDAERRLIKHIVRKLDVDKAIFLEMESSILTFMDIERELTWIKTTNKPYLTIEAMVNELMNRKKVILESVVDIISL